MGHKIPWARLLLGLAVVTPPLCIGGAPPWVLPVFVLIVAAFVIRVCRSGRAMLRWPLGLAWFGVAAAATALQWLPIGSEAVTYLAPGLAEETAFALTDTDLPTWSRLSVLPGATGMELARIAALGLLFFAAAQMPWRHTATATVVAATAVALVGVVHRGIGTSMIYGVYTPVEVSAFGDARVGILTSFVNPNHQSALLMLGIAAAFALLLDREHSGSGPSTPASQEPEVEIALCCALALQTVVLVLSSSRAALVLTLALYGPALVIIRLRARGGDRSMRLTFGALVAALTLALIVGGGQAWEQLRTLLDPELVEQKLGSVRAGLELLDLSPWLGIGRATAVDLLPLARDDIDPFVFTFIESVPVAFIVEWGPYIGGLLLLAFAGWWMLTLRSTARVGPRLLALGILAVAAHNCFDFNLEYLGVTASFVAIAGSISPSNRAHPRPRHALVVAGVVATLAAILAIQTFGAGRAALRTQHLQVTEGTLEPRLALERRPLDANLHTQLAREAAERGAWNEVQVRARVAVRLAPSAVDPWLLLGAAATATEHPEAAREADAEALRRFHRPIDPELLDYVVERHDPEVLAELLPDDREQARALLDALVLAAPRHADAAAAAWVEAHPEDPFAQGHRIEVALASSTPGLALHHARLYYGQVPDSARAALYVARALSSFSPPRDAEVRTLLENALAREHLDDPGAVEEQLIHCLRRIGTPEALQRANELAASLLERPAPREVVRRRRQLLHPIEH